MMTLPFVVLSRFVALTTLAFSAWTFVGQSPAPLDLVLLGGRVLDPETGLDAVRNIGIKGGRITLVASARTIPAARDTIDVHGLGAQRVK